MKRARARTTRGAIHDKDRVSPIAPGPRNRELLTTLVRGIPNDGPFDSRDRTGAVTDDGSYIGMAHAIFGACSSEEPEFGEVLWLEWAASWHRGGDPKEDERVWATLDPNGKNGFWDLMGYARRHGDKAARAAYYTFAFPDPTPEEEAEIKTAGKAAALANMGRMARFWQALDYDRQLAPNTQRGRVFDEGPSGFVTFSSNYLPTIGTITPRVTPWLLRNEVTSKIAGPATGKTTHLVLTAVAIATERPDVLGLKEDELRRFGDCILFCNEDPITKTHNQVLAVLKAFGLTLKELKHCIHIEQSKFVLVEPSGNRGAAESW